MFHARSKISPEGERPTYEAIRVLLSKHGAFFYNSAVNNIGRVKVTNVYNEAIVVNNTSNNVSYNGGKGGAEARATPQEQAAAKQNHVTATPLQTQQVEAASRNRALFSKENRGEPAIAATPRAGTFEGAGVTHAEQTPNGTGQAPNVGPKAEPIKAEPKAEPVKPEPKAEPIKAEPKAEPIKAEVVRPEPKAKPSKPDVRAETPRPPSPKPDAAKGD